MIHWYNPERYWTARYGRQGRTYVSERGSTYSYFAQKRLLEGRLSEKLTGAHRVLDFGCGSGRFRSCIEDEGRRQYDGVDLVPGLSTVEWDGAHLPGGYDAVVALYVLQHIVSRRDYRHWLTQLYASLNPGGWLVVVDHNPMWLSANHMRPRGPRRCVRAARWSFTNVSPLDSKHWIGTFAKPLVGREL